MTRSGLLIRPRSALLAASVLFLALTVPAHAGAPSHPAIHHCPVDDERCPGDDIDGDVPSDVVVGQPTQSVTGTSGSGTMDLHLTTAGDQRIDEQWVSPGFASSNTDGFGTASASDDIDADGYGDLVIGAPGASGTGPGTGPGPGPGTGTGTGTGKVFIAHGGATGITHTGTQILSGVTPGEKFGATVALAGDNLWIGAPNRAVNGHAGAGAVDWYVKGSDSQFQLRQSISQDSAGIGGSSEAGDGFGSALSANYFGALVGTPDEDIGTIKDAGMVTFITVNATNTAYTSTSSYQASSGVAGTPEAGDRFGSAVALSPRDGPYALVGVPGEDNGAVTDSGMVQLYRNTTTAFLIPVEGISQGTPGVPGDDEVDDHFGAAVAFTFGGLCFGAFSLVIGVPGEDVGSIRDAGTVDTEGFISPQKYCPWHSIFRGSGLGGTLAAGDEVGSTLTTRLTPFQDEEDVNDPLLIGAPGQSVDGRAGAGAVIETEQNSPFGEGPSTYARTITQTVPAVPGAHYGASITTPGGAAGL